MVRISEGETETETEGWEASGAACSSGIRVSCCSTTEALILFNLPNLVTLNPLEMLKFTTWGLLKQRLLGVVLGIKGRVENVERVAITTTTAVAASSIWGFQRWWCYLKQRTRR